MTTSFLVKASGNWMQRVKRGLKTNAEMMGKAILTGMVTLIVVGLLATAGSAQTTYYRAIAWVSTGHLLFPDTDPAIASGFGTSPSIAASNGATVFTVNVGTGGSATAGVITMPAATAGWVCSVQNITAQAANGANQRTVQTASSTTSVTVQNQTVSTGAALAWTASDVLRLLCAGY